MCGIFGYYNFDRIEFSKRQKALKTLMEVSSVRGKEASGLAVLGKENKVDFVRSDLDSKSLLGEENFKSMLSSIENSEVLAAIGHSRLATHGSQLRSKNNQPVVTANKRIVGVHNGIVTNSDELWKVAKGDIAPPELDSQALYAYIESLLMEHSPSNSLKLLYDKVQGTASIAFYVSESDKLLLATNTGSLYYIYQEALGVLFFASEYVFLRQLCLEHNYSLENILHLKPKNALIVSSSGFKLFDLKEELPKEDLINSSQGFELKDYSSDSFKSEAKELYLVNNSLEKLRKHDFDYERIYAIPRCKKCILPNTTPFISFDKEGVCNYCNEHKPIKYKGIDELKKLVEKYKKKNGGPNCLAAFSGGRDSSYGLQFLKNELGLEPLAYTYDWGMITDLGRRNQARILGSLGIEHIIVSADITMKRKHIKENILAWMKDPHLGMVPLFMEGDKQCEFHADLIMKKYDIDLMFFFRGNELEIDEFKTGHCGVKDADPGGVIHNLQAFKKLKMLWFYGTRYLKNPAYFNSSFFDTALAFFSTYVQKHNYVFLWHYIKWEEKTILDSLKASYAWETSPYTTSTWRTDDGTAAFYNYIYYQVQGFTENDSFRSRQIREGRLDRDTALQLVNSENKPRYESLKWYFDMVGLDGDEVLSVVDKMKKLY
ncbi:MAG: hypothetical protein H6579_05110 [Chitinophagales bacterium]|nr:hypothetical protein [Chitinophagales bacterium]